MKWSEGKKALHRQMHCRKIEEERLQTRIRALENERRIYQEHFVRRFRWWIELSGRNTTPNLAWLIEQDAKVLQTLTQFPW